MPSKHSGGRVNGMFGPLQTTGEQMLFCRLQPEKKVEFSEREGVIEMARAVGEAFKRAKIAKAAGEDAVYRWMVGKRIIGAKLPLVEGLVEKDSPAFQPGGWYARSKYSGGRDPKMFSELVQRVENQIDDFVWTSWQQVDE